MMFARAPWLILLLLSLVFLVSRTLAGGTSGAPQSCATTPPPLSPKRRSARPSLVVVSTLDGNVAAYDAATGASLFSVRSETPALASWAREGHPEYVPTLDGALYRLDAATGEAVAVDARFIAASHPGPSDAASSGSSALARTKDAPGLPTAGAVVLTAQSTAALSVNLRTGAVVRSLSFAGDGLQMHGPPGAVRPGDDIVLLSRTSIGVRVVDAATAEELANATLTHTNPSFLERGQCLVPAAGSDVNAQYTASISEDRARIVVRDVTGRLVWEKKVDSAVVEAHGMGAVAVAAATAEVEGHRAALPTAEISKPLALTESTRPTVGLVVAKQGKHRFIVNAKLPPSDDSQSDSKKEGDVIVYRVRDPFAGDAASKQNGESSPDGIAVMFLLVVVVCLMAGYALGRRPRRRARRAEMRRNLSESMNGTSGMPSASFDNMIGLDDDEDDGDEDRAEDEVVIREPAPSRRGQLKPRKKVRARPRYTEADAAKTNEQEELDDSMPISSTESTGSRSSGGVITNRSRSGWMNVGSLHVSNKVLGVGSHGTVVYEGRMIHGDRKVAVKRLLRQFFESARKEISLLVELDEASPHVVRYFAMEEDSEFIYLALELCSGTLAERVVAHETPGPPAEYTSGPAPVATTRALRQLLQGLASLHRAGVVHRDLKPQNVLISRSIGGLGAADVKLADVGLALRLAANRSSYTAISNAGGGVGTTGWRAPEVLRGGRQTKAVDIFAAGCIVCFVLTGGKHPFGTQIFGRDGNIASSRASLEPLEKLQLPEAVDIVKKMIHPESTERPTAEAALAHPFFWTDAMKLCFLVDISDRLYDLRNESARYTENLDRSPLALKFCNDWIIRMDMDLLSSLGRGYEATASGLLRVIRNKKNHYSELSPELQKLLGRLPDDEPSDGNAETDENGLHAHNFLTYFTKRVPQLLMCTYLYALENPALIEQPHFTRYGLKVVTRTESPALHPLVRKLQLERRKGALEVDSTVEEGKPSSADSVPNGVGDSADSQERKVPKRRFYERYILLELQKTSRSLPPALEERMVDCGVYSTESGARWTERLTTGVYEPFGVMTEATTDHATVDSDDEDTSHAPPGFESKQRFRNSAVPLLPRASPGRPLLNPSVRPGAPGRTMPSPLVRTRASPGMRSFTNSGVSRDPPPGFNDAEPFSLQGNSNAPPPFSTPGFRSINSVGTRRARMAQAAKNNSNNNKNSGSTNNNGDGEQRVIDFSQLRRR